MSAGKVLKELPMGKGVVLQIKHNAAEPESSPDRYAAEVHVQSGADTAAFYVPPHWHKQHTERMTVLEGRLLITLDGERIVARAGDPPVLIAPRAVHSLKGYKGERLVLMEQALPAGAYKAEFFNDMLQNGDFGANPALLIRAFRDHDTWFAPPKAKSITLEL